MLITLRKYLKQGIATKDTCDAAESRWLEKWSKKGGISANYSSEGLCRIFGEIWIQLGTDGQGNGLVMLVRSGLLPLGGMTGRAGGVF